MKLMRSAAWLVLLALAAEGLHGFPAEADARARSVCAPVQWLMATVSAAGSAMDGRGQVAPPAWPPWQQDAHGSCVRVAERIFRAGAAW